MRTPPRFSPRRGKTKHEAERREALFHVLKGVVKSLEEMSFTGGDLVTIGALLVAMLGLLVNAWRSNQDSRKAGTADVERIVRIDENSRETRSDVADIKAELRSVRSTVSDHERRIIVLEEGNKAQWMRIDEMRESETKG